MLRKLGNLERIRSERSLTVKELSKVSGVPRTTIAGLEGARGGRGRRRQTSWPGRSALSPVSSLTRRASRSWKRRLATWSSLARSRTVSRARRKEAPRLKGCRSQRTAYDRELPSNRLGRKTASRLRAGCSTCCSPASWPVADDRRLPAEWRQVGENRHNATRAECEASGTRFDMQELIQWVKMTCSVRMEVLWSRR